MINRINRQELTETTMPPLDKRLFAGLGEFDPEEIAKGEIGNFTSDVTTKLKAFGWDGLSKCCSIGLALSPDNRRVEQGALLVRGILEDKLSIEANRIWGDASNGVGLVLKLKSGELFTFSEGDLSSDIIDQGQVDHGFYKLRDGAGPTPILEEDYKDEGIGNFCLRMACVLSNNSSVKSGVIVKYTILLFPESKAELLSQYDLAQCAAWPGLRMADGYMPLLPRPKKNWGCPIIPLIKPGAPWEEAGVVPSPEGLRRAVSAMMRKTVTAETARSGPALVTRWRMLASNPGELHTRPGELLWPSTSPPTPEQGNEFFPIQVILHAE